MIALTYKENKSYKKSAIYAKKRFSTDDEYHKVRDHCNFTGQYRGAAHNISILRYKVPKKFHWFFIMVQIMTIILLLKT